MNIPRKMFSGIPSWLNARNLLLAALVGLATIARVLPHPWNFAPVGAIALFDGATFSSRRAAFIVPLLSLFVGDIFIGFHFLMPVVYASFLVSVLIGFWLRRGHNVPKIAAATFTGALQFFAITNFAMWASGLTYPKTFAGLAACYIAGIPFFWNTLAGDALYATLLFGSLAIAEHKFPVLRESSSI